MSLRLSGRVRFPDGSDVNLRDVPEPLRLGSGVRLSGHRLWNLPDEHRLRANHFSMELVEMDGTVYVRVAAVDRRRIKDTPLPRLWVRRRGVTEDEPLVEGSPIYAQSGDEMTMQHGEYSAQVVFVLSRDDEDENSRGSPKRIKVENLSDAVGGGEAIEEDLVESLVGSACGRRCGGHVALRRDPRSRHLFYGCSNYGNPKIKCRYHDNEVRTVDKEVYWREHE